MGKKERQERPARDSELARTFYAEIMQVVEDGRVSLEAVKIALELCREEIEERQALGITPRVRGASGVKRIRTNRRQNHDEERAADD